MMRVLFGTSSREFRKTRSELGVTVGVGRPRVLDEEAEVDLWNAVASYRRRGSVPSAEEYLELWKETQTTDRSVGHGTESVRPWWRKGFGRRDVTVLGVREVGRRRDCYATHDGREDAVMLALSLPSRSTRRRVLDERFDVSEQVVQAFEGAVNDAFAFLRNDYGFADAVSNGRYGVSLNGPSLRVNLTRDYRSGTVDLDIYLNDIKVKYSLEALIDILAPQARGEVRCGCRDVEMLTQGLERLAGLCRSHLRGLFELDQDVIEKVEVERRFREEKADLKCKSDLAWKDKDWRRAFLLYDTASHALEPYQKRRLEFLRRKLSST